MEPLRWVRYGHRMHWLTRFKLIRFGTNLGQSLRSLPRRAGKIRPKFIGYPFMIIKSNNFSTFLNTFVSKVLALFRSASSQFLRYNLNRSIINYNIKNYYKSTRFLFFNRFSRFYKRNTIFNYPPTTGYLFEPAADSRMLIKKKKSTRRRKVIRRILTFWVSRVTQRTLTPIRREFDILNRKKLKYQHRLTVYVFKYYNFKVLELVNKAEFTLLNVILRSHLLLDKYIVAFCLQNRFLFVNGISTPDPTLLVYRGDVLQLSLQLRLTLFLKWSTLSAYQDTRRFFFYLRKWRKRSFRPYPKKSSHRIPSWIRSRILYKEPIPTYLEVDLTTSSAVVLYNWTTDFAQYHYTSLTLNS